MCRGMKAASSCFELVCGRRAVHGLNAGSFFIRDLVVKVWVCWAVCIAGLGSSLMDQMKAIAITPVSALLSS